MIFKPVDTIVKVGPYADLADTATDTLHTPPTMYRIRGRIFFKPGLKVVRY